MRKDWKKSELIEGAYYYSAYTQGWIIKYTDKTTSEIGGPCISDSYFYRSGPWGDMGQFNDDARLATDAERRHLDACIAAGKYVEAPKEEINNHYEIY